MFKVGDIVYFKYNHVSPVMKGKITEFVLGGNVAYISCLNDCGLITGYTTMPTSSLFKTEEETLAQWETYLAREADETANEINNIEDLLNLAYAHISAGEPVIKRTIEMKAKELGIELKKEQ